MGGATAAQHAWQIHHSIPISSRTHIINLASAHGELHVYVIYDYVYFMYDATNLIKNFSGL